MPLTELMHYFNDQLQAQAKLKSLPTTGFYKTGNAYGARFSNLTLSSRFRPIENPNGNGLVGHDSELLVRAVTGREFNIDDAFESLDDTDQIIHLDRLTRTLHSLNYLQQYDNKELLSLTVQPRHIVSVTSEHGKAFEKILSDCGLGPERVLLRTRLLDTNTLPHFQRAFVSYKSRGYKIGINILEPDSLALLEQLAFEPDFIFSHLPGAVKIAISKKGESQLPRFDSLPTYRDVKHILVGDKSFLQNGELERYDGYLIPSNDLEQDTEGQRSLA